jgi:crotonobetainyl-CoA:carnitine CoA-transferase CaiB-like acyl-CoA transferase
LGQHIDLALLDVQITAPAQRMNLLASGKRLTRNGNAHPNIVA